MELNKILLTILMYFCCTLVYALPNDGEQKLNIVSDSQLFNYRTGVNVYEGNVKAVQGSSRLVADKLETKTNEKHKLKEAIAYGIKKMAEYSTTPKKGDKPLHAKAMLIKFYPLKSLVVLEGDVFVTQGDNSFQGPIMIYNMKDQIVTAPHSKTGRATLVIDPKQLQL